MTQLRYGVLWGATYDVDREGVRVGSLHLTTRLTITIRGDEAILEPKVTGSVVYEVGRFFGSASILDVLKLLGEATEPASDVECPMDLDPWTESELIERHFYDVFRRHGLNLANRSFRKAVGMTRVDVMWFLRVAPHRMMLAGSQGCSLEGQLWELTPHDVQSPFWYDMGADPLYNLSSWIGDNQGAYENLLTAMADVRMVLCSWDRVTP